MQIMQTYRLTGNQNRPRFITLFQCLDWAFLCFFTFTNCTATWLAAHRWLYKRQKGVPSLRPSINLQDSYVATWGKGLLETGRWSQANWRQPTRQLYRHGFVGLSHAHMHNTLSRQNAILCEARHTWQNSQGSAIPANESLSAKMGAGWSLFMMGHSSARPWEPNDWKSEFIAIWAISHCFHEGRQPNLYQHNHILHKYLI